MRLTLFYSNLPQYKLLNIISKGTNSSISSHCYQYEDQSKNILNPILKEELSYSDRGTMSRRGFVIEIKELLCFYLGLLFLQRIINQLRAYGAAETCFPAGRFLVIKNFFFSSNLVGRIFFSLLNALQDIFFPPHFSAGFFFSSKKGHVFTCTKCIYIYIVVIAVIVLIWSCKALKCCKLYKIIIV